MKAPSVVYKYLSCKGGLAALRNFSVKYTPIDEFNDPFEGMVRNFSQHEKEDLISRAYAAMQSEKTWRLFCDSAPFQSPDDPNSLRRDCLAGKIDIQELLELGLNITSDGMMKSLPREISKHVCVACFSARKDSILMWSHYAQDHKGVVIGYQSRAIGPLYAVRYSNERVPLPVGQFKANPKCIADKRWHAILLTTKFSDWQYEQEWRGFEDVKKLRLKTIEDKQVLLQKLSPQSISEIIMGTRIDERLRKECLSFAKLRPNCKLYQARYHSRDFALVLNPVR